MTWRHVGLVLLSVLALAATQPPDESNIPESEKRIPQGHYCKRADVTISPNETKAHPCSCTYSCEIDSAGNVTEHESSNCQAYCKVNGRRCTCHPEGDPSVTCSTHGALMNMDGEVIAVARHP